MLTEARHVVLPSGIVSTGWPSVEATCRQIGIKFDSWQRDLNRCILAKNKDGLYAADTVVISIPRQVGKTFDIGAVVFALCIKNPGLTVVWTAHRFKVSRETFNELRSMAKSPKLVAHLEYEDITTAAGNECIPFRNGSRIVFAARERGAIRGFTKVAVLILDEAQILTHSVLADLAPTMNQAENPLIILMGTPPKPTDPGEVFTDLRAAALDGTSEEVLYVELSAPVGSDPDDREALRVANPSYPERTPDRAIRRLRRLLTVEDFLREVFGIWDSAGGSGLINTVKWAALEDAATSAVPQAYGIEISEDRSVTTIGMAGLRDDGLCHLELFDQLVGTGSLLKRCQQLDEATPGVVFVIDEGGQAASEIADLEAAGLQVIVLKSDEIPIACADFLDGVNDSTIVHGPQAALTTAVEGARKKVWRDGGFSFGRRASNVDIGPLVAVTLAAAGLKQLSGTGASAYVI